MNYKHLLLAASAAALLMSGCETKDGYSDQDDIVAGYAVFNPTEGLIPYPNNILFAPNNSSTNDFDGGRTLNIPYEPEDDDASIVQQLNVLTGFSTISPITAPITATLDEATMPQGVQVYEVSIDSATGAVTGVTQALTFGVDFVATQSGSHIVILPLVPLKSLTTYMVVFTNDLKDSNGRPLAADLATALTLSDVPVEAGSGLDAPTAAALEMIRQGNQAMFAALSAEGKDLSKTVQIWNFRTQLIGAVQSNITAQVTGSSVIGIQNSGMSTKDLFTQLGYDTSTMTGSAQVYVGKLMNLPQYMPQASAENPLPALTGQFDVNSSTFAPAVKAVVNVPLVATLPSSDSNCTMPAAGWPVVIYQHGITRVRTDLFVYGETFASYPNCYAAVAIDLPLHGITESNTTRNPLYAGDEERTFNIDVVTEDENGNIIAEEPDGIIDSSGTHYINLSHIATTRDNLHQTTADLLELETALATASIDANPSLKFDTNNVHFLAHSLGTIAAAGYVNKTTGVNTITLAMPGQGLAQLLNNSMRYGPIIEEGLAAKGIIKGTAAYESFMVATQTITDDADPANYTVSIGTTQSAPILAFEVVGDGITPPCSVAANSDNVIPNCVATAPLSGTEPFLRSIGATNIDLIDGSAGFKPLSGNTAVRLTAGAHASPLYPDAVTKPIHAQIISFIASQGTGTYVIDPAIIYQEQ